MKRVMGLSLLLWGVSTATGCAGAESPVDAAPQEQVATRSEALVVNSPHWKTSAPMPQATYFSTAALLKSGVVLVAGGFYSREAFLYNPYSDTWTSTSHMSTARYQASSVRLASGKVLVSGGIEYWYMNEDAELYDPSTGTWSSTGSMERPRWGHQSTLLRSGKVLVTGGEVYIRNGPDVRLEPATYAELYDPATGEWSSAGELGHAMGNAASVLNSGEVVVAGWGVTDIYNPSTNSWRQVSGPAIGDHSATRLYSGQVLAVANYSSAANLYDPYTKSWSAAPSTNQSHADHTSTLLYSGKVLLAGGRGGTELYDPATNTWTQYENAPGAYKNATALLLHTGQVMLVGGDDPTATVAIFTP